MSNKIRPTREIPKWEKYNCTGRLRVEVKKNMETSIERLFTVGDGAGVSRGIVIAAATGIIAAREIAKRSEHPKA